MTAMADRTGFVSVATLTELKRSGLKVVTAGEYPVLLLLDGETVRAVDNRCPHMGYPLSKGTVSDGMIRCHWHDWRFELCSGGCLTGGPTDLPVFPVEIRGDQIWVRPEAPGFARADRVQKARDVLQQGLEQNSNFTLAKAVAELGGAGVPALEMVRAGALHAVRFRQQGFGPGAVILTVLARLLGWLDEEQRIFALVHGLTHVARDTDGRPPRRLQRPLPPIAQQEFAHLKRLFRTLIEQREPDGAERILRTAIESGATDSQLTEMLLTALTDHFFLDTGHSLDFTNKAFETVDLFGGQHAAEILTAVVGPLARSFRHEEDSSWADSLPLLREAFAGLKDRVTAGLARRGSWTGEDGLVRAMLDSSRPGPIIAAVSDAIAAGALPNELCRSLGRAAVHRVLRYPASNEEDWDSVLHLITYANAYDELMHRLGPAEPAVLADALRGLYHGAVFVYLTHFLNIPRAKEPADWPKPVSGDGAALRSRLLWCGEFQQVDEAGAVAWAYLKQGEPVEPLYGALAQIVLREDAAFHTYQMLEAGIAWHRKLAGHPDAPLALAATARYLSAQRARRFFLSNTQHALKLRRGEAPEGE
jgi:nitrite reductase/ring-hydroxylating ferredoxin subunit